jgi:Rieske Fe-S protein
MSDSHLVQPTGADAAGSQRKRWQAEFPYHWDADDLVSRRELLHLTVYTSGALFACTAFLAGLGVTQTVPRPEPHPIARVGEVPEGQAVYFRYPAPDDQAMLLHLPGGEFVAYSQKCTHLACSVYYQPERARLYCPCHEGVFNPQSGDPVAGPPVRRLPRIALRREGEVLYAVDVVP